MHDLEALVREFYPFVSSRLHTKLSLEYVDGDVWLIAEKHLPDGSFADAETYKFQLVNK